ncbi:MAG: hypothetical protein HOY69_22275 [Streptomyces sp.]|nr:hypothetical protein [Streptomyces sp.]
MTEPRTPLSEEVAEQEARRLIRDAYQPTAVRIDNPDIPSYKDGPRVGSTPPVPQPGIPPMSARTTEITRAVMYASLATVPPGLIAIGIMVASQHANPTVIGMICAAPAAIAVPILAVARLVRRAGEAAPTEIHQTYTGNVHQETRITHTRAVWAKTINRD